MSTFNNSTTTANQHGKIYSSASIIGQTCFYITIITAAVIGNSLVIMGVWSSKRLQKSTNYFIVSLAVSDILIVTTIVPFWVHHLLNRMTWDLGLDVCRIWFFMDMLCTCASTITVALIAIDRFLALSYPFKYPHLVTGRKSFGAIATVWLFCLTLACCTLTEWSEDAKIIDKPACAKSDKTFYVFASIVGLLIPMVIVIVAYSLVFRVAFHQAWSIKTHSQVQLQVTSLDPDAYCQSKRPSNARRSAKARLLIRELKATKTLMIVVGTFIICWAPLIVIIIVQQLCRQCFAALTPAWQEFVGMTFVHTLPRLNSAANPIIYSIFNREFRSVLCLLCGRLTNFLPCKGYQSGATHSSGPRSVRRFCGIPFRGGHSESTSDSLTAYEAAAEAQSNQKQAVFTFKKSMAEQRFHESNV